MEEEFTYLSMYDMKNLISDDKILIDNVIDQLKKNEKFAINQIDEKTKENLLEENEILIKKLKESFNNLIIKEDVNSIQEKTINESILELNDNYRTEFKELTNQIESLKIELNEFKKQLNKQKIDESQNIRLPLIDRFQLMNRCLELKKKLDHSKSKIKFGFTMKNVKKFFEKDNYFFSEQFTFSNFEWKVKIKSNMWTNYNESRSRYLGFLVILNKNLNQKNTNWQCNTICKLKLKSNLTKKVFYLFEPDRKRTLKLSFRKDGDSLGLNNFINVDQLFDLKNGFIKDDSISLELELTITNLLDDN